MTTKAQIVELLRTNDKAVARALVVLCERQTADEQASEHTHHNNGRGFRPCHARMGTSMAKFYSRNGYLTPKQIAYWRAPMKGGQSKIEIYAGQLLEVAEAKAAQTGSYAANAGARDGLRRVNGEWQSVRDAGNLLEERMVMQEMAEQNPQAQTRLDEINKELNNMNSTAYSYDMDSFSDLHKEAYGFRPSESFWQWANAATPTQLQSRWDDLANSAKLRYQEQCDMEAAALVELQIQLDSTMREHGVSIVTAIRWLHDAHETNGDNHYLDYKLGVKYDTINKMLARIEDTEGAFT
jgi:hypothetical protein